MLEQINLLEIINEELVRKRGPSAQRTPTFYPSGASIPLLNGRLDGACHRSDWYRIQGVPRSNHMGQKLAWRAAIGKEVENIAIDQLKRSGKFEANNLKFYDSELNVSGELDIVCRETMVDDDGNEEEVLYGVEVKSIYGNYAVAAYITGRRAWRGRAAITPYPRLSNLLQTMLYVWHFRDQLVGFKLLYVARDTGDQREYNIKLRQFEDVDGSVKHCAEVDGVPNRNIVLEDIHERFALLKERIINNEKPPREFQLRYDQATFDLLCANAGDPSPNGPGTLSQTKQKDWEKGEEVGDFQCGYCNYKDHCYADED